MEKETKINTVSDISVYKHPDFYFDDTLVFIKLEDMLFSVHKSKLLKSKAFSKWFESQESSRTEEHNEGLSPETPITMQGIVLSDFEAFLKVLYAREFSDIRPLPEVALIIPAYRLAVLWQFSELQDFLFSLVDQSFDDAGRIAFAKAFGLKAWLHAPHVKLCQRDEPLTLDEAKKIGIDSLLVINNLREEFPPKKLALHQRLSAECGGVLQQQNNYNYSYSSTYVHCGSCLKSHPWPTAQTVNSTIETRIKEWVEGTLQL
ncbi:unnamed protein product [Rhizoctonia solani]|uniref:BTB domain-containing protein n=1 Tax=Rhizoctonia solani TaxID=456999 RepID=A0A8H3BYC1_9AGAM|nr:unnamed protein product [Rhizoctonia solani]